MIVELHNKLGSPQRVEATRVVLRDPIDGVLAIAVEVGPRHYWIIDRGDGDEVMNRTMRALGINETVISDMLDDLPKPEGKIWTPPEEA